MWKPDIPDSPSLSQSTPEVSHSDNSECRSDWRWSSLQPRKPLKLKAAWTGKSSIIFMGVSQKSQIPWISQNKLKLTGVLEFVTLFPWKPFSSPPLRPWLFSGKDVNAFTMVPMLDDLSLSRLPGVFMSSTIFPELGRVNYEVENRLPTGSIAQSHTVSLISMLPYPFVFHRWGMFLPWDGARSFLHVLGWYPERDMKRKIHWCEAVMKQM